MEEEEERPWFLNEDDFPIVIRVKDDISLTPSGRIRWGFVELEVGETTTVYDPDIFDKAMERLRVLQYKYKDRRFLFGVKSGFFQVTRTR